MEATQKRLSLGGRRLLGTRSGTLILAAGTAVLAGLLLIIFLSNYRDDVRGGAAPTTVLVAGSLIPKGTSGDVVIDQKLFAPSTLTEDKAQDGAVADASALAGKVAVHDIYPGQQLAAKDFEAGGDAVRGRLTGTQRAVSIPVDSSHGLVGTVRSGDRVDVLASFTSSGNSAARAVIRPLAQNVLVLHAPPESDDAAAGGQSSVVLRVSDRQASALSFAADNGKIWLTLRPPAGANQSSTESVNLGSVLSTPASGDGR